LKTDDAGQEQMPEQTIEVTARAGGDMAGNSLPVDVQLIRRHVQGG
jgi:hypothetical protein